MSHCKASRPQVLVFWITFGLHVPLLAADAVIKTAVTGQAFNQFQEVSRECQPGCTRYGNCNRETGECECPFGLTGPLCETPWLPACRTTTKPGVPLFLGRTAPRNCRCYEQLRKAACPAGLDGRCGSHMMGLWADLRCFEFTNQPEEQQLSELPERVDDPGVVWKKGVIRMSPAASGEVQSRELETLQQPPSAEAISHTVPLSRCPSRCNDQGICRLQGGQPACVCHSGFARPDCSQPGASPLCPNDCGGRGRCISGFCKCDPPYWGIGCARSKAYEPVKGSVHHPHYPSLKVYIYDVPMNVAGPQQFDDGESGVYVIYQAFIHFMSMLLRDTSGIRTENPYEANLFYVPAFAFYSTANLGDPTGAVVRAVDWAAAKFPFFHRHNGSDHFVVLTPDRGACYLKPVPQTQNLIRLVHFGLEQPNMTAMGPLAENAEYGCFKSGRDVVMAPFFKPKPLPLRQLQERVAQPGGAEALLAQRKVLLFFSGDVRPHEPEYSGGVRQILYQILAEQSAPDIVFKGGFQPMSSKEYESLLSRSKFCLAPYGHGWGIRLAHAIMHACVPVIIQDRVRQPYEDFLNYPDFSIRVSKAELPRLVEILRAVPDKEIARLMREISRIYRAFIWQPEMNGLAYHYAVASLWRRLSHLRGELYEAGTRRL